MVLATASPAAGGPARRGRSSVGGGRRWRCGRRAGGAAPGWQRDAVHTGSDGRRRRAEAMVLATASGGGDGMRGGATERLAAGRRRALRLPRWRRRSGYAVRFHTLRYCGATPRWRSARGPPRAADGHVRRGGRASRGGRRRRCNLVVKTPLPLSKKVNSEL